MFRLSKEFDQVADDVLVSTVEEGGGSSSVSCTTGTTDSVNVIVNVGRKIVVDDVSDLGNIESSSGDGGSNHDGSPARSESLESEFTFALSTVTVNRGSLEVVLGEETFEEIGHSLRFDEDERQSTRRKGEEDVEKDGTFVVVFDVFDLLSDVLRGRSDTTDGKEDVVPTNNETISSNE